MHNSLELNSRDCPKESNVHSSLDNLKNEIALYSFIKKQIESGFGWTEPHFDENGELKGVDNATNAKKLISVIEESILLSESHKDELKNLLFNMQENGILNILKYNQ